MQYTPNERGMRLTSQEIEQISTELTRHITANPPLEVVRQGAGIHLRLDYESAFLAKITSGSQPYAWSEVEPRTSGGFQVPAYGRNGTTSINPAYEINGSTTVASGTYVFMSRGFFNYSSHGQEFLFATSTTGSGGGGGSNTYTGVGAAVTASGQYWPLGGTLLFGTNGGGAVIWDTGSPPIFSSTIGSSQFTLPKGFWIVGLNVTAQLGGDSNNTGEYATIQLHTLGGFNPNYSESCSMNGLNANSTVVLSVDGAIYSTGGGTIVQPGISFFNQITSSINFLTLGGVFWCQQVGVGP